MKNIDRDFLDKELSRRGQVNLDDLNLEKLEIDGLDLDNIDFDNMDFDEMMEIGGMIEKALDTEEFREIEDLIEMPSKETFQEWIELGEQKYRKRVRRKRILSACAAVLIICIGAVAAINCFKPPTVEAELEDRMIIESVDMETTDTYTCWSDLPQEIQDQFIEVKDLPDGYSVEEIVVMERLNSTKLKIKVKDSNSNFIIRQCLYANEGLNNYSVSDSNTKDSIEGVDVFIEKRDDLGVNTYKYISGNVMVDIVLPIEIGEIEINNIIRIIQ